MSLFKRIANPERLNAETLAEMHYRFAPRMDPWRTNSFLTWERLDPRVRNELVAQMQYVLDCLRAEMILI